MKPVGVLMWEHRLIERVIGLLPGQIALIGEKNSVDTAFIDATVDFIRVYADRTHHGKEEDILFRKLEEKALPPHLAKLMEELINDHVHARGLVKGLVEARDRYAGGEDALSDIAAKLEALADFYPAHIVKEDRDFFFPCMDLMIDAEQQEMIKEFESFDRKMIHEKYRDLVERLGGQPVQWSPPGLVR